MHFVKGVLRHPPASDDASGQPFLGTEYVDLVPLLVEVAFQDAVVQFDIRRLGKEPCLIVGNHAVRDGIRQQDIEPRCGIGTAAVPFGGDRFGPELHHLTAGKGQGILGRDAEGIFGAIRIGRGPLRAPVLADDFQGSAVGGQIGVQGGEIVLCQVVQVIPHGIGNHLLYRSPVGRFPCLIV